jgi:hypothetical protein
MGAPRNPHRPKLTLQKVRNCLRGTRSREGQARKVDPGRGEKGCENTAVFGDWNRVIEVDGLLMDHYPRRYRVREFPDKSVLDATGLDDP